MENIIPLEQSDPELAQFFLDICNKKLPAIVHRDRVFFKHNYFNSKTHYIEEIFLKPPKNNDPCLCGSGKKFKKCCKNK